MQAYILRKELQKFLRRAWRRYPTEHIEALFGLYHNGEATVTMVYELDSKDADQVSIDLHDDAIDDAIEIAKKFNLRFLGTIHTHPGYAYCSHASSCDLESSVADGEILFGVYHLYDDGPDKRRKSQVTFMCPWEPVTTHFIREL